MEVIKELNTDVRRMSIGLAAMYPAKSIDLAKKAAWNWPNNDWINKKKVEPAEKQLSRLKNGLTSQKKRL